MAEEAAATETTEAETTETTEAAETTETTEAAETTAATETTETEAAAESANWRDGIQDAERRKVAERSNTLDDLVQSNMDLRKQVSTSVRVPGKDATDEETAAFNKAMGVPETAEGYVFAMPEGVEATEADTAFQNHFAGVFHKNSVPKAMADAIAADFNAFSMEMQKATVAADKAFAEETEAILTKDWGDDKERNDTLSKRAAPEVFGSDLERVAAMTVGDKLLLDTPEMRRALAKVGAEMGEGRLGPNINQTERASLQEQADNLNREKHEAIANNDPATAARKDKEQLEILEKLDPGGAIVGTGGRIA